MRFKFVGALLAVSVAAAHPALAADDLRHADAFGDRSAAFGGFTVRVPLGQKGPAKPQARLQLTTYKMGPAKPSGLRTFNSNGLELGVSRVGKPMLFSGGQNTAEVQQKMGLSKTTTWLIVGGVVLVVALVAAASASAQSDLLNPCSGEELDCD